MNIFIGCSSSEDINDEYKIVTKYLAETLSKDNDLVFGCTNRGLMGICYREFKNNNRKIIGVCYEMYKDDLKDISIDEVYMVNNLNDSNKTLEEKSDMIIFLPGAFGTLTEFMYMLETKRTLIHNKDIILFNVNGFYDGLIDTFNTINRKVSKDYNFDKICKVFSTVDEVKEYIERVQKSSNNYTLRLLTK